MPRAAVPRVVPNESIQAMFGMEDLGKLTDEGGKVAGLDARRQDIARRLISNASAAADRIADGVGILEIQPDALEAFRIANRGRLLRAGQDRPGPS